MADFQCDWRANLNDNAYDCLKCNERVSFGQLMGFGNTRQARDYLYEICPLRKGLRPSPRDKNWPPKWLGWS